MWQPSINIHLSLSIVNIPVEETWVYVPLICLKASGSFLNKMLIKGLKKAKNTFLGMNGFHLMHVDLSFIKTVKEHVLLCLI